MRDRLGLQCHRTTVGRYLHKEGIHRRIPAVKPLLTEDHRRRRLQFCQENLNRDWSTVVFSDEKNLCTNTDYRPPLWRRCNTRYDPANITPTEPRVGRQWDTGGG
ncbi:unnamed protein product [Acanthoscelides obtectus]|uniref:Transposase Tc1-like domain-containing protein n=1 Tax=Acanthoscelides obtectus TaxID=200917 RepID=A0A9P0L5E2_ACAOB|nr:unnamed protein product [Acanthoscelides obtectus]CAK1650629.1 hypothetical protein AOBTE_LOCUS16836 [Acanthoscelides obtectus]